MATYKQIVEYVKNTHGYTPKTCWIAHMKEVCGLNPKASSNRNSLESRTNPCPTDKHDDLRNAFRYFKMI